MYNIIEVQQRIMKVLDEMIAERGTNDISVGLIAEKAHVSKGLIYRYFGGIQGLLDYYVRESGLFPHFALNYLEQLCVGQQEDAGHIWSGQMIQFFRQLRSSKASREVIKASLVGEESLAEAIHQTQHQELINLAQRLPLSEEDDSPATLAILLGGLSYLTLMAHNNQPMLDIDLRSEAGWQRVEEALKAIYQKLNKSTKLTRSFQSHSASSRPQAA